MSFWASGVTAAAQRLGRCVRKDVGIRLPPRPVIFDASNLVIQTQAFYLGGMIMELNEALTVQKAAKKLGIADSSVRRICLDYEIGTKVGRDRLLSRDDVEQIKAIRKNHPIGRPAFALN